ncbi:hypothetical protein GCM10011506_33680 [Marivirga lumbricoides]|uniref:Cadherin domain-containing protein n=3 Tax=Marivirga lumbricoides TaxID=1046115 RepID=A0ABQ1MVX4_9BACT|nr:hypothetical protein GCM10011506_33680 [Marivirga lumbricoides]
MGAMAYADVDGINGLDVLITGTNNKNELISKLYINDGTGNYTEKIGTPFVGVTESSVAFADVDGNGSPDVLISGYNGTEPSTLLYTNDGLGNFSLSSVTFEGVRECDIAFAEVDNVPGPDVLITGKNSANQLVAELYLNDGTGAFTSKPVSFGGINKGAVAFADIDGNGTQDVVITGLFVSEISPGATPAASTKIYVNDGNAGFTPLSGTAFPGVRESDVAFADVDGDNTQDLLYSGFNSSGMPITKLYTNEIISGKANFTEVSTPFDNLGNSAVAFADVDAINGPDVLITGTNSTSKPVSKLYVNNGSGVFSEASGSSITNVSRGAVAFLDMDLDNNLDLVVLGRDVTNKPITKVYSNNSTGEFNIATGMPFTGVRVSSSAFADVDGNGTIDAIISGTTDDNETITKLYINDGNGNFTEDTSAPFVGVGNSAVAFADVDGENGPDVMISGLTNSLPEEYLTLLYINDGAGNFTKVTDPLSKNLIGGSIAFSDVNDDGFQDVVITGIDNSITKFTKLSTNNGSGNFSENTGTAFTNLTGSSIAFADVDGQNGPDLIISGESDDFFAPGITELYLNDGSGNFSLKTGSGYTFTPVINSSIAVGDLNGDSSDDLLVTGLDNSNTPVATLYLNNNDGTGRFTKVNGTPFEAVENGSVVIANIDGVDGNDIIISGENASGQYITKLYTNNGSAVFTEVTGLPFDGVFEGDISLADVDSDGLLDVLITGKNNSGINISKLYRNTTDFVLPTITSPATVSVDENVILSFYTATADEEVSFSLGNTKDEAFFKINGAAISFINAPDFETPQDANADNVYLIDLIAVDKGGNEVKKEIAITVVDVNESGPVITSPASVSVEENVTGTVYTTTADVAVTFSLGSSKDEALFSLATNDISFKSSPDFETPKDANSDNVYKLDLIATDGDGIITTKAIQIIVTDLDETYPIFTSAATASVAENTTGTIYTAIATGTNPITYSLGSDNDESFFDIDENTGEVTFNSIPDYENPSDANADNDYVITVIASDGVNSANQVVTITVTDVVDETRPSVSITSEASSPVSEAFDVEITFSEMVTGFTKEDLILTNAMANNFSGNGTVFKATVTPMQTGTLTISIAAESATDASGNGNIAADFSIGAVIDVLSSGKQIDMQLLVYPNPATDFIRVETNRKVDSYQLLDVNGKLLKTLHTTDEEIEIGDLDLGVYFIKAIINNQFEVKKFIKK